MKKFTFRQVYEALLYGPPKMKHGMIRTVYDPKKDRRIVGAACANGRAAYNLGLINDKDLFSLTVGQTNAWNLYDALNKATPRPRKIKIGAGSFLMNQNDNTEKSIEEIAEEFKRYYPMETEITILR